MAMAGADSAVPQIEYYLVLDFEATCNEHKKPKPQEIIEFPVLKVNATTMVIEATYLRTTYGTPSANSILYSADWNNSGDGKWKTVASGGTQHVRPVDDN